MSNLPKCYHALVHGGVPNSFDDTSTSDPSFPVVIDSRASLSISPLKSDFIGHIQPLSLHLGGMARGMPIVGKGNVEWTFTTPNGTTVTVKTLCYYVPDCPTRLLSPQQLFNKSKGIRGKYIVEEDHSTLQFEGAPPLVIEYNSRNWLPTATARNNQFSPNLNLCITSDANHNLSPLNVAYYTGTTDLVIEILEMFR